MNVTKSVGRIPQRIRKGPGKFVLGLFLIYLSLDLLAKLLFFRATIGSVKLFGGAFEISEMISLLWNGTVVGLSYGLAAVGLSIIYSILEFPNVAHGDYFTVGSFVGWSTAFVVAGFGQFDLGYLALIGAGDINPLDLGMNILATPVAIVTGLVVAAVATVALVLLIDRLVFKPIRDQGVIALALASIGVALVLRYVVNIIYGSRRIGLTANAPQLNLGFIDGQLVAAKQRSTFIIANQGNQPAPEQLVFEVPFLNLGSYTSEIIGITGHEVVLVASALVLMYGLHVLLQRTKLGTAMRAMSHNKSLARITGIPTEKVVRHTWIIAAAFVGIAGYLFALESGTVHFRQGWVILLLIFAAVIVGGIGSIYGAMAGGFTIGIANNLSLVWLPSSLTTVAAFMVLILILLFKPEGIFGGVTTAS